MSDRPKPSSLAGEEDQVLLEAPLGGHGVDPDLESDPLGPSDHLRQRQMIGRIFEGIQTAAALLAVAVLITVVWYVFSRGLSVLSIGFLTNDLGKAGGIAPALVGTALLLGIATLIAMPLGILVALYGTEFAGPRSGPALRLMLDLLNGIPTIITGLFVFGLLVVGHHQSGFAGAFALAIVMLPLIARATQEVLALVPSSLREAADALGVSHWRTVLGVVLPSARSGILTAIVLAVARAAGETAPLIFVTSLYADNVSLNPFSSPALSNIPVYIFTASEEADSSGFARAWGAAFVLLSFILILSVAARTIERRSSSLR